MSEKKMNARILHKHDTEVNWDKATGFIPKEGELIIYNVDNNHSKPRFKVGDGKKSVIDLPFAIITQEEIIDLHGVEFKERSMNIPYEEEDVTNSYEYTINSGNDLILKVGASPLLSMRRPYGSDCEVTLGDDGSEGSGDFDCITNIKGTMIDIIPSGYDYDADAMFSPTDPAIRVFAGGVTNGDADSHIYITSPDIHINANTGNQRADALIISRTSETDEYGNVTNIHAKTEVSGELYYNGDEVATKADLENIDVGVTSVNNKTGAVTLKASDVGALSEDTLHGVEFTDNSMELPFRTHEGAMGTYIDPYEINAKSGLNINAVHTNGTLDDTGWKDRNIISYVDYDPITPGEEYTDILTIGTEPAGPVDSESTAIREVHIKGKNIILTPELEPYEGVYFRDASPAMEITGTDEPVINTHGSFYHNNKEVATKDDIDTKFGPLATGTTTSGESYIKVGSTTLTESQLVKILKFIESVEEVNE